MRPKCSQRLFELIILVPRSDLGNRLGLTLQPVEKYERGANRIGSGRLVRIASVLGVPLRALLYGAESAEHSGTLSPLRLIDDRWSFRLAYAFAPIKERALRRSLVSLVESVSAACARRTGAKRM
jgi:transcriptional regulator with XRE-family HTH domain